MFSFALNELGYCVNAHMTVGEFVSLTRIELLLAMGGRAIDSKTQALFDNINDVVGNRDLASEIIAG